MERFKASTRASHAASLALHCSLEASALVRTLPTLAAAHRSLPSLLAAHLSHPLHPSPTSPAPLPTRLDDLLRAAPPALPAALLTLLTSPPPPHLTLLAVWPAQPHPAAALHALLAAAAPSPPPALALLVIRDSSRQDLAALPSARAAAAALLGPENVLVLALDAPPADPRSPAALAAALDARLVARVAAQADLALAAADRARKAARTSFRSWFAAAPAPPPNPADPALPPATLAALTRDAAFLLLQADRPSPAADQYRLLLAELRASSAPPLHLAAAEESLALSIALSDGSKQAVGTSLEAAVQLYCRADRRDLAVRATLRAVDFCVQAGFPDSAAGVIVRAVQAIAPPRFRPGPAPASALAPASFVEGAVAVLYDACADAYVDLGRTRRASLYAFLAATRFAKLRFYAAAARVARIVDETALLRAAVRDDVELIFGHAELAEGRCARAVAHFVGVMSTANQDKDVEVQGAAVRGFLVAAAKGAREAMAKRWDKGALFPIVETALTRVSTYDCSSNRGDDDHVAWTTLEDDVLEDFEFFSALAAKGVQGTSSPQRERRVEAVVAELRKKKDQGDGNDPGGSLELKIKRMQEVANARKKRRRAGSLLDRGAVVGEKISLHISLKNPLHFPVFLDSLSAVVSIEGRVYDSLQSVKVDADVKADDDEPECEPPVEFLPTDDVTLVPSSTQWVTVDIVSRTPGTIQILGLTWNVTVGMGGASPMANASTSLPGFCLLERKGRRLNTTRQQRASEVPIYEKDKTLIVTVAPCAPKLKASVFCGVDGTVDSRLEALSLRAGETRQAILVLRNEGKETLKDIVVRIGTPHTLFLSMLPLDNLDGENNSSDTVVGIGMDEQIVHQDELAVAARMPLNLEPNGSTSMPVWLRAAVPSSAFSYRAGKGAARRGGRGSKRISESDEEADSVLLCDVRIGIAYGTVKVRVSRVKARFKVLPSILVSPRFLREADQRIVCFADANAHGVLLGLEVEHGGHSVTENLIFQVTELSITSRGGWRPMLLQNPTDFEDHVPDEIAQSITSLRINETATVFFFVVRDREAKVTARSTSDGAENVPGAWQTFSVNVSEARLAKEQRSAGMDQGSTRSDALKDRQLEQRALRHFVLCMNSGSHGTATVSKHLGREQVYLSVGWKSSSKVRGDIHIPPIDPLRWMNKSNIRSGPGSKETKDGGTLVGNDNVHETEGVNDLQQEKQSPDISVSGPLTSPGDRWLDVKVSHPANLEHDFFSNEGNSEQGEQDPIAAPIPAVVPVDVFIRNVSPYLLDVVFAAPSEGGIADGDRGRFWSGDVAMSLRALPPGAQRILSLTAVLISPGRFNMSKFAVLFQTCGYSASRVRQQVTLNPSYLFLAAKGATQLVDGEHDRLPLTSPNPERAADVVELRNRVTEEDEPELAEVNEEQTVHGNGNDAASAQAHHDGINHQDKRIRSESPTSTSGLMDKLSAVRTRMSPRKGVGGFGSPRSRSLPVSGRKKLFPRARSEGAAVKIFRGSADDALWNASDTDDESEE